MQIDGANIFNRQQSPIANVLGSHRQSIGNSQTFSGKLVLRDQVSLSTRGLSQSEKTAVNSMNSSIVRIAEMLEEMKKLSQMAEKDDLSDETRLDLQVNLTRLQANLHREAYSMGLSLSGKTYGSVSGQQENLGGTRAFSTISVNDGFFVNDKGQNCVSYTLIHDIGTDVGPIDESYADLNIGEIQVSLMENTDVRPGQVEHLITLIEASGDSPASKADDLIGRLLDAKHSGVSLENLLADESFTDGQQMELLTANSAKRFTNRIDREINKLDNLRKELSKADFSQNDADQATTGTIAGNVGSDGNSASQGEKEKIVSNLGEMSFRDSDKCDIRLLAPTNQVARIFQTMDNFFKDSVYKNLGIGNLWALH